MSTDEVTFQAIKKAFSTAPVLWHFDQDKEYIMETDALDYISAAVLSQPDHKSVLGLVIFILCRHLLAECKYKIYDKKLLSKVQAFEKCCPELEGSS